MDEPNTLGDHRCCFASARKISWVETWPKCSQGDSALAPSTSGWFREWA